MALLEIGADQGGRSATRSPRSCPAGAAAWSRTSPGCLAWRGSRRRPATGAEDLPSNLPPRVEPAFPIRLLALDIDGTLVGDTLVIGPRTRRAVRAASARGVAVSLVTGRMVSSAMRFARELELTAPIVGLPGRPHPRDPAARLHALGRLLVHTPLAAAVARDVLVWTREHGLDPHVNHLERFILRADDPRADDYSAFWALARSSSRTSSRPRSTR